MNRTIKDGTVRAYHCQSYKELRDHLAGSVAAYNFARRLKAPAASHPTRPSAKPGRREPHRFRLSPDHLTSGLNI